MHVVFEFRGTRMRSIRPNKCGRLDSKSKAPAHWGLLRGCDRVVQEVVKNNIAVMVDNGLTGSVPRV